MKIVLFGFYFDMVLGVGWYDGILGVFVVIEVVGWLCDVELFFVFEVVVFGDEEGMCFGMILLGLCGLVGIW